jgi:hypothetical protein
MPNGRPDSPVPLPLSWIFALPSSPETSFRPTTPSPLPVLLAKVKPLSLFT